MQKQVQSKRQLPNKYVYVVFLALAIVFLCVGNYSSAIIFGGIGLAFDPFDQSVTFSKRPLWQRVWLVAHLLLVLVILWLSLTGR